jgi:hypothetical protein
MPLVVLAITRRLQRQFPEFPPLTLSQEIAELPAKLDEAGIEHGGMETNVPRPAPIPINGPGAVGHSREVPRSGTNLDDASEAGVDDPPPTES